MKDNVERLATKINACLIAMGCINTPTECKAIAYDLIVDEGWIHKEDAVKYVGICQDCRGNGKYSTNEKCGPCLGKGLVPLKEPNVN